MGNRVLEEIKAPVVEDIAGCERYIRRTLCSEDPGISSIIDYVMANRGKGLRPLLTVLTARILCSGGDLPERTFHAAMMVEMVHTASLIHDDIIDSSYFRHGHESLLKRYGGHMSVVVGDLILSRTFLSGLESGCHDITRYVLDGVNLLCEGELLQDGCCSDLSVDRETYLRIIYMKTASLFAVAAGVGALSAGADDAQVSKAWDLGYALGMAFQIRDDMLDFDTSGVTGKPAYADLRERKLTLPVIHAMERSAENARIVREAVDRGESGFAAVIDLVESSEGMAEARRVMDSYLDSASKIISSYPASPFRDSLEKLCAFIGDRAL